MFGLILAAALLLWMLVAARRAVIFVGEDMLESWRQDEDYTDAMFREAVGAGLLHGIAWPIAAPMKTLGSLFYRLAYQRADRAFRVIAEQAPEPMTRHDVTDEIAMVEAEPLKETRAQAKLRREADKARAEYGAGNDEARPE